MTDQATWGVCATVNAPARDILRFAAHHLDEGAHRVWIFLDAPDPAALSALKAHPKCRVTLTDSAYWKQERGQRPKKHQVRQSHNATRTYARAGEVDWLLAADVDEFAVSDRPIAAVLTELPDTVQTARVRPMEALSCPEAGAPLRAFKAFIPPGPARHSTVAELYPRHGAVLKGGFLSHVAGKVFLRTGLAPVTYKIHNVFLGEEMNPQTVQLDAVSLAHLHANDWDNWRARLDFRLEKGAYRAELPPARHGEAPQKTLHDHLTELRQLDGETGLRAFFDEVALDTPEHRQRLAERNLLRLHDLALDEKLARHFSSFQVNFPSV